MQPESFPREFPQLLCGLYKLAESAPVERWHLDTPAKLEKQLDVLRLDKINLYEDQALSGNKQCKLLANLLCVRDERNLTMVSFGGEHSNHLWSLAAAGNRFGFSTIGLINGQRPTRLSATLDDARRWGMHLYFLPRRLFKELCWSNTIDLDTAIGASSVTSGIVKRSSLDQLFTPTRSAIHYLPLGASNVPGVLGSYLFGVALQQRYPDYRWLCAAGSGAFATGLALARASCTANARPGGHSVVAVSVFDQVEAIRRRSDELQLAHRNSLVSSAKWVEALSQQGVPIPVSSCSARLRFERFQPQVGGGRIQGQSSLASCRVSYEGRTLGSESVDPVYLSSALSWFGEEAEEGKSQPPTLLIHGGGQQGARN